MLSGMSEDEEGALIPAAEGSLLPALLPRALHGPPSMSSSQGGPSGRWAEPWMPQHSELSPFCIQPFRNPFAANYARARTLPGYYGCKALHNYNLEFLLQGVYRRSST